MFGTVLSNETHVKVIIQVGFVSNSLNVIKMDLVIIRLKFLIR